MAPNPDPNGFTPGNKNRTQIDTYIDGKLSEYREGSDHILWAAFTQDFKEWTVENLKTASVLRLAKLIVLLKSNGVYVDEAEQHRVAENEITEVRWINGNSNPADAMTKSKPCRALQELIDTNKLRIDVDGWVERPPTKRTPSSKSVRFTTPDTTPAL
ncbi:hypothetical protein PMAA_026920 [Talaromyces marneffei ATCC 18224]|uniref:Uncharacterized protein n=1 Tax=Talaromyces marneffei (strain ATCC 18224 / CBS 334.59 / QM 7333) TaxID=441960 RepID=B6Q1I4_TALMQ|nr:hypothetical protein PMAA_026920 [Talaromyces marneffei ATCC 18224]